MEGEPLGQQHDLNRHDRYRPPRHLTEQRQRDAGKHIDPSRTAIGENGGAGAHHMIGLDIVAGELQGKIGFDRRREVEIALFETSATPHGRPACREYSAQFSGLERRVDFVEIMLEQDILRRDGGIGFEFEGPMAVRPLQRQQ